MTAPSAGLKLRTLSNLRTEVTRPEHWWSDVLSPTERFSEILFGLIMVLSITGTLSVAGVGEQGVRGLLIGATGCNTAWGLVDAVMYLITTLVERYRTRSLLATLRDESDDARGRAMIAARLPPLVAESIRTPEMEHVRQALVGRELPDARLTGHDLLGALAIFLLVFLSTFPVVLPFLLPLEEKVALRISNGVAILLLFVMGYRVGAYVQHRPLTLGLAMVAIGAVLVATTIALGG